MTDVDDDSDLSSDTSPGDDSGESYYRRRDATRMTRGHVWRTGSGVIPPTADDVVGPILVELLEALGVIAERWAGEMADEAARELGYEMGEQLEGE